MITGKRMTATIANGESVSGAVNLEAPYEALQVVIPTIDSGTITLQGSLDGETYYDLSDYPPIDTTTGGHTTIIPCGGFTYIKVKSSTTQTDERTFTLRGVRLTDSMDSQLIRRIKAGNAMLTNIYSSATFIHAYTGAMVTALQVLASALHITPTVYNVAIANADTEVSQVLPAGTSRFQVREQGGAALRLAFVAGKVAIPTAPYLNIPAGHLYDEEVAPTGTYTLYLASPVITKVAEIICWQNA